MGLFDKPFNAIPTRVRKDPFGPGTYNQLRNNLDWLDQFFMLEHRSNGEHNSAVIPRTAGKIAVSGGTYTASGFTEAGTTYVTLQTGHHPATGRIILTLEADIFDVDQMAIQVQPSGQNAESKPMYAVVQINSATEIEVFTYKLSSSLGSGNSWAAVDTEFFVAINSLPLGSGPHVSLPTPKLRGDTLTEAATDWNLFVTEPATLYSSFSLGHNTGSGQHDDLVVARFAGNVVWDGASYNLEENYQPGNGLTITSLTRAGAGILTVATDTTTAPAIAFCTDDYARSNGGSPDDVFLICPTCGTSGAVFYIYQFDGSNWTRADTDFFFTIHSEAS